MAQSHSAQSDALSWRLAMFTSSVSADVSLERSQAPASILAGGEIALLLRCGHVAGFKRGQFGPVARLHPVIAVGHIPLVIGHGQCNRFRFREF